jgi:hypothetical protein
MFTPLEEDQPSIGWEVAGGNHDWRPRTQFIGFLISF